MGLKTYGIERGLNLLNHALDRLVDFRYRGSIKFRRLLGDFQSINPISLTSSQKDS
jgi:hypothetical protein